MQTLKIICFTGILVSTSSSGGKHTCSRGKLLVETIIYTYSNGTFGSNITSNFNELVYFLSAMAIVVGHHVLPQVVNKQKIQSSCNMWDCSCYYPMP